MAPARVQTYIYIYIFIYLFIPHLAPARVAPARVGFAPTRVASARVAPARVALGRVARQGCPRQGCPPGCPRVVPAIFHIFNLHFLSSNIPLRNSTNNEMAFFLSLFVKISMERY